MGKVIRSTRFLPILFMFFVIIHLSVFSQDTSQADFAVQVNAYANQKMNLLLGAIGKDNELNQVTKIIKQDFEFSGQFNVTFDSFKRFKKKKDIGRLFDQGYPLAIFLSKSFDGISIEWRLYDTLDATMLKGKKVVQQKNVRYWAHAIANELWPELTGQLGFFLTKIAYCKEIKRAKHNSIKHIFIRDITDHAGESDQLLVGTPTINIAPRWNKDVDNPLLLYSEYTAANVRLMVTDMQKRRRIASNFDGLNMQAAFSEDGQEVVYWSSRDGRGNLYHYCFDKEHKKGIYRQLTNNRGNNFAPSWGDDNVIYFSSDASKNNLPQICALDLKTKKITLLTDSGYCTCPSYSPENNKVAYTKMVNRKMQIFLCDPKGRHHEQITFDDTNKEECSWSPCGNYLVYSAEKGACSQIAILNLLTREQRYITPESNRCSYPAWSPQYRKPLAVV